MRSSITAASLLASGSAAFAGSSPFLILSSSPLNIPASTPQLQSRSSVLATANELLASCPTQSYTILTQPNAHASDIRDPVSGSCTAKNLCQTNSSSTRIRARFGVAEVVGEAIGAQALKEYIEGACTGASVSVSQLDALPEHEGRESAMRKADEQIGALLQSYDADFVKTDGAESYTVLYFASPHEPPRSYESEFVDAAPMELRRRLEDGVLERAEGSSSNSTVPLFVKYQFFTPGLFMAFLGSLVMFAMLWAGLSAVASLQVSYGAFDKEMGPAAQKKVQ
ncbi:unnamed protein product [Discula destructiva]